MVMVGVEGVFKNTTSHIPPPGWAGRDSLRRTWLTCYALESSCLVSTDRNGLVVRSGYVALLDSYFLSYIISLPLAPPPAASPPFLSLTYFKSCLPHGFSVAV